MKEISQLDAPRHYSSSEASAWACGYGEASDEIERLCRLLLEAADWIGKGQVDFDDGLLDRIYAAIKHCE